MTLPRFLAGGPFPAECPLVLCGECSTLGRPFYVVLDEPTKTVFRQGVNGYDGEDWAVEYHGWDVEHGGRHDANEPIPLTKSAWEMIAISKEDK